MRIRENIAEGMRIPSQPSTRAHPSISVAALIQMPRAASIRTSSKAADDATGAGALPSGDLGRSQTSTRVPPTVWLDAQPCQSCTGACPVSMGSGTASRIVEARDVFLTV